MHKSQHEQKTRSDKFPLTLHKTSQYCKKIKGKLVTGQLLTAGWSVKEFYGTGFQPVKNTAKMAVLLSPHP
ncbi:MAG: hypothetical protein PHF37_10845 [Phycisphaerae bacterium]|nr:hypothetical protein [Phycisphaerae bacterium]